MTGAQTPRRVRADGPKIREIRRTRILDGRRAMTAADLAMRCDMTRRAINMIENGVTQRPYERTMRAIAVALQVSVDAITLPEPESA